MLKLLISTTALLLLPLANASDCHEEPAVVMGDVIDANTIQISLVLDGEGTQPGDIVPLCDDEPLLENETRAIGTVQGGCFQSSSAVFVSTGPVICDPVRATILPEEGPPITPNVDEACIEAIIEYLIQN